MSWESEVLEEIRRIQRLAARGARWWQAIGLTLIVVSIVMGDVYAVGRFKWGWR